MAKTTEILLKLFALAFMVPVMVFLLLLKSLHLNGYLQTPGMWSVCLLGISLYTFDYYNSPVQCLVGNRISNKNGKVAGFL